MAEETAPVRKAIEAEMVDIKSGKVKTYPAENGLIHVTLIELYDLNETTP